MCLAIYQPAGNQVPESHLEAGWDNNPHGGGFMYFDDAGKLCTFRSMKYCEFIEAYECAWALHGQQSPFAVHFRWATHGTTDINNVHPFVMNDNTAVMHNGIIDCIIDDSKMSDTASFVQDYLANLPKNWQDNKFLFDMVSDYARGSKLIVLTSDKDSEYSAYIVNERLGIWVDEVWYSNGSYSCVAARKTIGAAQLSAMTFEQEELYDIDECLMCGEESVLDGICYHCESCQECSMTEEDCECGNYASLHAMTDAQFDKNFAE